MDSRELGHERYFQQVVDRLLAAIRPDDEQGEPPLLPILNRYQPKDSTADVNFRTTRPVTVIHHSHINSLVTDSEWERTAAYQMEHAALRGLVKFYARNDGLGFTIPYESMKQSHAYEPDFLVRLSNDVTLILEIKGQETEEDRHKYDAARRWVNAVNNWGKMGCWAFHVNRAPQMLLHELSARFAGTKAGSE